MNSKALFRLVFSALLSLGLVSVADAGGWAIVTLKAFPDYAIMGKPLQITFSVRQHGQTLLSGLQPRLTASTAEGLQVTASALPGRTAGEYVAALTLPQPGDWHIAIDSGFNGNIAPLPSLNVIRTGSPAPAAFSPGTRGLRLFTAKGCEGCHRHIEVNPGKVVDSRFDLTGRRFPPDSLRKFLADPGLKTVDMPNLKLNNDEIDALAAFINKTFEKKVRNDHEK